MADRNGSLPDEHESAKPAEDAKEGISTLEPNEVTAKRKTTGCSWPRSETTDNETAEENSCGAIQDSLHPKAGPRLYFGDQKARKDDREMPVQLQRDTNISAYQPATDRVGPNVQEQEASRIASYGTINLGAGELGAGELGRIQRLTDSLMDSYYLAQVQEQQKLLDAVLEADRKLS
jgi:hypothetical protein